MNQDHFVAQNEASWDRIEHLLGRLEDRGGWDQNDAELPALYRRCCQHLAITRQRQYGADIEERLHEIALRGYRQLYGRRQRSWRDVFSLLVDFPVLVRAHAGLFWLATALFYLPALAMMLLVLDEPDTIYALLNPDQVASFEEMYRVRPSVERGADADFMMFGFYIYNNISIAFRTFASGLLLGVGTLVVLTFNGLHLGGVLAHLVHQQSAINLTSFVITHGAFELTALVISGVAGLRLGGAIIAPGRRSRVEALRRAGLDSAVLISGTTVMLLMAAFIEAFWSSTAWVPPAGKYTSGVFTWGLVIYYLGWVGRGRAVADGDGADGDGAGDHHGA